MPEAVSSETIDSLATKLADFADALTDDERHALDQFFLQPPDVEGFVMEMAQMNMQVRAPLTNPARRDLYNAGIIAILIG